jgi:hypothetical protein
MKMFILICVAYFLSKIVDLVLVDKETLYRNRDKVDVIMSLSFYLYLVIFGMMIFLSGR